MFQDLSICVPRVIWFPRVKIGNDSVSPFGYNIFLILKLYIETLSVNEVTVFLFNPFYTE